MTFVYPYKRKTNDFSLIHSIRCVLKHYPDSEIVVIGDKPDIDCRHIPFIDSNIIKGANVTAKLMLFSRQSNCDFIFMNDDFFINERFDFDRVHQGTEQLERKEGKASIAWNQAVDNSKHWLEHNGFKTITYECHQPVKLNSNKFIDVFSQINWRDNDHFIKSIYFNVNEPKNPKPIENVKLIEPNINKANKYLTMFGCISISESFLTEKGSSFIKTLI